MSFKNHSALHAAGLVNIHTLNPRILLDIRYATANNFTGQKIYAEAACYAQATVARKLDVLQQELELKGLGLKIWDAYRPLSAQRKLWEIFPDPTYVADPAKGSKHNRGSAIDLTLVDRAGNELLMPTAFDNFTEQAHRHCVNLPAEAIANRQLLQDAMERHGFIGLPSEWWHFDDVDWEQYPVLDIDF